MGGISGCVTVSLLCLLWGRAGFGDTEAAEAFVDDTLPAQRTDSFDSDTRGEYAAHGGVLWQDGRVVLPDGAQLGEDCRLSAAAELKLDAMFPDGACSTVETRVIFSVRGMGESTLVIRRTQENGDCRVLLQVVDRFPNDDGELVESEERRIPRIGDLPPGPWTVRYHHGLLTWHVADELLISGYILNGAAPLEGWRIEQRTGTLALTSLTRNGRPAANYTEQQQADLQRCLERNQQLIELFNSGRPREALAIGEETLQLREAVLGDAHYDCATSLNNLARLHETLGDFRGARPLYERAVATIDRAVGTEHPEAATMRNNLAVIDQRLGDLSRAEDGLLAARDVRRRLLGPRSADYAASLNNLATLYDLMGRYPEAKRLYEQALAIRRDVFGERHPEYAQALNNLAQCDAELADYTEAEALYREAADVMRRVAGPDHPNYALCVVNLAAHLVKVGQPKDAEPLLLEALQIYRNRLGEAHPRVAVALSFQSEVRLSLGDVVGAEELLKDVRRIYTERLGGRHPSLIAHLMDLASLYVTTGETARAEACLREARDLHLQLLGPDHPTYPARLAQLGYVLSLIGNHDLAESYLNEARERALQTTGRDHSDYAHILVRLGLVYLDTDRAAAAVEVLQEAHTILESRRGPQNAATLEAQARLASALFAVGQTAEAGERLRRMVATAQDTWDAGHVRYSRALRNLARFEFRTGQLQAAASTARQAVDGWLTAVSRCVPSMSEAQAIAFVEAHPSAVNVALACATLSDVLSDRTLYRMVWNTRAAATRFLADGRLPDDASPEVRRIADDLKTARREVATLAVATDWASPDERRVRLAEVSERKEALERELAAHSVAERDRQLMQNSDPDDLAALLPDDVALIDFVRGDAVAAPSTFTGTAPSGPATEQWYHAFVLRRTPGGQLRVRHIPLGSASVIDAAVTNWRRLLRGEKTPGSVAPAASPADDLRRLLWAPCDPHLAGCRTVVVIPDGRLTAIAWSALPGRQADTYLLEDFAICTAPFAQQVLVALAAPPAAARGLCVVGDIDYGTPSPQEKRDESAESETPLRWESLAGAAEEAQAVASLFREHQPGELRRFRRSDAREQSVSEAMTAARYVHFATHGFFASGEATAVFGRDPRDAALFNTEATSHLRSASFAGRNPLVLSGLVLSHANHPAAKRDGAVNDGILLAEEVVNLELRNTELVVLSACETGLGEVAGGEGVFGLQRAFALSGARSSIASLWKVNDAATLALMTEFYRNHWERGLGRLESLRQAQLSLLQSWDPVEGKFRGLDLVARKLPRGGPHLPPFYWAAFQLSGDWR